MARAAGPANILTTTLDKAVAWARTRSMWPAVFGLACCAIEMMGAGACPTMTSPASAWRCSERLPGRRT